VTPILVVQSNMQEKQDEESDSESQGPPSARRRLQLYKEMMDQRMKGTTVTVGELSDVLGLVLDQVDEQEGMFNELNEYIIQVDIYLRVVLGCFPEINHESKWLLPFQVSFDAVLRRIQKLISLRKEATSARSSVSKAKPESRAKEALSAYANEMESLKKTISELAVASSEAMGSAVRMKAVRKRSNTLMAASLQTGHDKIIE